MENRRNLTRELNAVKYADYPTMFKKMRELAAEYGEMPMDNLVNAFSAVKMFGNMGMNNPFVQNRRVKGIGSLPSKYDKNDIADFLKAPGSSEQPLRQAEKSLEISSYPLFHMRTLYQNLLTYHNHIVPTYAEEAQTKTTDFMREWKLLDKLRMMFDTKPKAHEITGQALQEGKVFYYPRYSVDKAHNKINHAFMQQLPSDWCKIVGFNNKSKYTIAFNMMYFTQPGTDYRQFGSLFEPYIMNFMSSIEPRPKGVGTKIIYAQNSRIDMTVVKKLASDVNAYYQNGRWFYWVTLPVDKVFTFEVDDVNRNVFSPFTGLFLDLIQLVAYEDVQLALVQNPLVSVLTGEIPYFEDKGNMNADQYKLSNAGRTMFEAFWYQMLARNNTSGIGLYAAPFNNMQLHTLAEAPSAMEISSNGYGYTLSKAGLSGIVPTSGETRSGMAQISVMIESVFAKQIYTCFERMWDVIIESLNLKYTWRLEMFGTLSREKEEIEESRNAMTLGILPATLRYLALHDMTLFDDLGISDAILNCGIMDKRMPLQSSYQTSEANRAQIANGKTTETQTQTIEEKTEFKETGRPRSEDPSSSEGHESDVDNPPAERK